jgi:hypothetical protein
MWNTEAHVELVLNKVRPAIGGLAATAATAAAPAAPVSFARWAHLVMIRK